MEDETKVYTFGRRCAHAAEYLEIKKISATVRARQNVAPGIFLVNGYTQVEDDHACFAFPEQREDLTSVVQCKDIGNPQVLGAAVASRNDFSSSGKDSPEMIAALPHCVVYWHHITERLVNGDVPAVADLAQRRCNSIVVDAALLPNADMIQRDFALFPGNHRSGAIGV